MPEEIKHRLPSTNAKLSIGVTADLPDEYKFEWVIGRFFMNFSSLETTLTEWIIIAIDPLHPVYGHVAIRDTNFMHKIRLFGFLISKKMTFSGDTKLAKKLLEKVNAIRNHFAHGVLEITKSDNADNSSIEITMPSNDFLISNSRKEYTYMDLLYCCNEMFFLIISLEQDAKNHFEKINKKRRIKS